MKEVQVFKSSEEISVIINGANLDKNSFIQTYRKCSKIMMDSIILCNVTLTSYKVKNRIIFNFRGKKADITELSRYLEKLDKKNT